MELNQRQLQIVEIVKALQPITGEDIAKSLELSRATIRPDLSVLTMLGILGARPKLGYFFKSHGIANNFSGKVKEIKVKELMSIPVLIDEESSIYDAIVTVFLEDIGSVFITQKGKLIGVVSRKDLLRSTLGKMNLENTPVSVIMTRMPNLVYAFSHESVYEAALKIYEHNIDSIAVVETYENGEGLKVVGRFTKTNITTIFIDLSKESY